MSQSDRGEYVDWGEDRREGYVNPVPVAYAPMHTPAVKPVQQRQRQQNKHLLNIQWEERVASMIAAAGAMWAAYVATVDYTNLWHIQLMPPGPIEICALGVLAWLHAKWRRSAAR